MRRAFPKLNPIFSIDNRFLLLILLFYLSVLSPTSAKASFITLETKPSSSFDGKRFKMTVAVTNNGDEAAYNLQISAGINNRMVTTPAKESLGVKEKYSVEMATDLTLEKAGRYPVIVNVDYMDANQYPFSAISITHFVYRENLPSQIFGTFRNIEISTKGSLVLSLKNLGEKDKNLSVRLVLPKELSSHDLSRTLSLKAKSEEKASFEVNNFSALPGSAYSIFAVMEYDEGGLHYSNSVAGNIKITKEQGFVRSNQRILVILAIILVTVFIYFNLRFFLSRRSKTAKN